MEFPNFSLLPAEIRLEIWTFALPDPRIVPIFAVTIGTYPIQAIPNPAPAGLVRIPPALTQIDRLSTSSHPPPAILSACRESRAVALKWYKSKLGAEDHWGSSDVVESHRKGVRASTARWSSNKAHALAVRRGKPRFTLLDPSHDILFLQDPTTLGSFKSSSILVMARWIGREITETLRLLAIPYYSWRRDRERGRLTFLTRFTSLECLYISFLSSALEPQNPGWISVMNRAVSDEIESHMLEMEREVREDLDRLSISRPYWKRPKMRFVKDVHAIKKDLGLAA